MVVLGGGGTGLLLAGGTPLPVDIIRPWGGISTCLRPPASADRAGGGAGGRGACLITRRRGCCGFSLRLASSVLSTPCLLAIGHFQHTGLFGI